MCFACAFKSPLNFSYICGSRNSVYQGSDLNVAFVQNYEWMTFWNDFFWDIFVQVILYEWSHIAPKHNIFFLHFASYWLGKID